MGKTNQAGDATTTSSSSTTTVVPKVVAQGASPRALQFPSPIYFSEWVSDTHVVVGAGGGGQRFGMANVLALLRLNIAAPPPPPTAAVASGSKKKQQPATHSKKSDDASVNETQGGGVDWALEHALDLGDRVPWCCTGFLPARIAKAGAVRTPPAASLATSPSKSATSIPTSFTPPTTLLGTLVTSHMDSFSLIRVCAATTSAVGGPSSLLLESSHVVPLAHDDDNPDKKCIAAMECPRHVRAAFIHNSNDNGTTEDNCDEEEAEEVLVIAASDDGCIQPFVVPIANPAATDTVSAPSVVAGPKWVVGCRANDISIRMCNVSTADTAEADATDKNLLDKKASSAPSSLGIVAVAAMQDKHLYVARLHIVQKKKSVAGKGAGAETEPAVVTTAEWAVLQRIDGASCGLSFPIMRSSLKFARIVSSQYVLMIAYDANSGNSYMNVGTFSTGGTSGGELIFPAATPVLGEGITAFAPLSDTSRVENLSITNRDFNAELQNDDDDTDAPSTSHRGTSLRPTPLPRRWIVGTVDGSISVVGMRPPSSKTTKQRTPSNQSPSVTIGLLASRPPMQRNTASNKGTAANAPATRRLLSRHSHPGAQPLHQEPISSVSVAPSSGRPQILLVSTDIAQKLIFSVITPVFGTSQPGEGKTTIGHPNHQQHVYELFPVEASLSAHGTTALKLCLRCALIAVLVACLVTAALLLRSAAGLLAPTS